MLQITLQAYQVLERRDRQTVSEEATASEQLLTAESMLRSFRAHGCNDGLPRGGSPLVAPASIDDGGGGDIIVGNVLAAGVGGRDLLITGAAAGTLNDGEDILIGGATV